MNIHQLLGRRNETRWLVQLLLLFSGFLGNQTHIEKLVIGSSRGALLHLYHVYQAGSFQQFITFPYKNTFEKKKPGLNLLERAMPVTHHYQHLVCSSSLRPKKKNECFSFSTKKISLLAAVELLEVLPPQPSTARQPKRCPMCRPCKDFEVSFLYCSSEKNIRTFFDGRVTTTPFLSAYALIVSLPSWIFFFFPL